MDHADFQNAIRIVYCMGFEDFQKLWGKDDGAELWFRYTEKHDRDVAEFICYLDLREMSMLFDFFKEKNEKRRNRSAITS